MKKVLPYYNDNVTKALLDLFPNIGFSPLKMFRNGIIIINSHFYYNYINNIFIGIWDKSINRRQFFEKYAKEKGFDALIPDHWYVQPRYKIRLMKVLLLLFYLLLYCFS